MTVLNFKKEIEELMDNSNEEYDKGNYLKSIEYLIEAWGKLPVPKYENDESFHIVRYICETYLITPEKMKAKEWVDKIFQCDLNRIDCGDREFLAGKVAYELGDLIVAKEYFSTADKKSEGRCFIDEDIKYRNCLKG